MTKEELEKVIQHFKSLRIIQRESFMREGFDMAIKALEQEPCDDCISRFEVTEILNSEYDIDKMLDRVDELSSVTPIRPKGHWIDHSDEGYVECPKCGSATNCDDNINDLHFCFSCGAEMSEVEE